jgi:hypothetical protein
MLSDHSMSRIRSLDSPLWKLRQLRSGCWIPHSISPADRSKYIYYWKPRGTQYRYCQFTEWRVWEYVSYNGWGAVAVQFPRYHRARKASMSVAVTLEPLLWTKVKCWICEIPVVLPENGSSVQERVWGLAVERWAKCKITPGNRCPKLLDLTLGHEGSIIH